MSKIYVEYKEDFLDSDMLMQELNIDQDEEPSEDEENVSSVFFTPLYAYRNPIENQEIDTVEVDIDFEVNDIDYVHIIVLKGTKERDDGSVIYGQWNIHSCYRTRREALEKAVDMSNDDNIEAIELYSLKLDD